MISSNKGAITRQINQCRGNLKALETAVTVASYRVSTGLEGICLES